MRLFLLLLAVSSIASAKIVDDLAETLFEYLHKAVPGYLYTFSRGVYGDYEEFCRERTGLNITLNQFTQFTYANVKLLKEFKDAGKSRAHVRAILNQPRVTAVCHIIASSKDTRSLNVFEKLVQAAMANINFLPKNYELFARAIYKPSAAVCHHFDIFFSLESLVQFIKEKAEDLTALKRLSKKETNEIARLLKHKDGIDFCRDVKNTETFNEVPKDYELEDMARVLLANYRYSLDLETMNTFSHNIFYMNKYLCKTHVGIDISREQLEYYNHNHARAVMTNARKLRTVDAVVRHFTPALIKKQCTEVAATNGRKPVKAWKVTKEKRY